MKFRLKNHVLEERDQWKSTEILQATVHDSQSGKQITEPYHDAKQSISKQAFRESFLFVCIVGRTFALAAFRKLARRTTFNNPERR
ncbi:MAG: hypothetical protein Q7V19_03180 [Bacteroidales bacterium]|nr:hypothetical protein [Bacteroidales bacterium]